MKLNYDITNICSDTNENFRKLESEFNRLSKYVMESKKFEKFAFGSIIFFYAYILIHILIWVFGKVF